jgi:hypothetical protein
MPRAISGRARHRILLGAACLLLAGAAQAEIYKYVDKEGRVTYSNVPMRGAKKLDLGPIPAMHPAPRGAHSGHSSASESPSPANFPRVDDATQKNRDQGRRGILMEEMGREQNLLTEARQQLAAAPQNAKARDNVTFHEKNIEALQKEIGRIK